MNAVLHPNPPCVTADAALADSSRAYNSQATNSSDLLHLPSELLCIIARKMGKRARLLCTKLCQLYGALGTTIRVDAAADPNHVLSLSQRSIIRSLRHPSAVRRLVLGHNTSLDGHACCFIAEALPNLLQLSCGWVHPPDTLSASGITAPTSLTALSTLDVSYMTQSFAAFAPNLRSVLIRKTFFNPAAAVCMWGALASLRGLQCLRAPLSSVHLVPSAMHPSSFSSAMEALTGLTHLGLHVDWLRTAYIDSPEITQSFAQVLAGLPLLSGVSLCGVVSVLGPSLGAALQALGLTGLHVVESLSSRDGLAVWPFLRACQQAPLGGGSGPLRALALTEICLGQDLDRVCAMIARLSGLTNLTLQATDTRPGRHHQPQSTLQLLADTLHTHTQLRRLGICANLHDFLPCLAGLPALTSLDLSQCLLHGALQRGDLQVVSALSSLRQLSLRPGNIKQGLRAEFMSAVRGLPLLEQVEVQLNSGEWTEEEVAVLLPPPEALQRVVLVTPAAAAAAGAALDAITKLGSYDLDVVVKAASYHLLG
jgi:hypothetical protein